MQLGIDIGGTHTDGVLLDQNNQLLKHNKLPTQPQDLTKTILTSCQQLTSNLTTKQLDRLVLSTTLATNLIVKEEYRAAGLLLIPGPGLNPDWYSYSPHAKILSGSIDHRGREVKSIDEAEIKQAIAGFIKNEVLNIGICGKFSTRNPEHELKIKEIIEDDFSEVENITLSHKLSGKLNYPRRVATTYLNTGVQTEQNRFISDIQTGLNKLNLEAPVYILKADGGTMSLQEAKNAPIKSINSGPAASIMGIFGLTEPSETSLGLDIGGTTTDISLFIGQEPIFKPKGITINDYKTSVRGLYNQSIGAGGDSLIQIKNGNLKIGPQRKGPAAAFGGPAPTPTDALVILGLTNSGDKEKATASLKPLAEEMNLSIQKLADRIITEFCSQIQNKINQMLTKLNNQPVYTINKLLTNNRIRPTKITGIGGPAKAIIPKLADRLNLNYEVPNYSPVANAIGAALARTTRECTLYADTSRDYYNIPELGIEEKITAEFNLKKAERIAKQKLKANLKNQTPEIEITNNQAFNLVRGFNTTGQIIEVTAQVKPGRRKLNAN
ncbi:hydantoinase/oxoprolinase family protein [Acetohalobium arabaticum]|uniref:Hydantoinase/oxoprolinase n=1 Tax=Acetohalobium arabaticum (strain ATCC 49924 / DSM 5501 / Z-7288) TaxID=574087 RepID=D9QS34_ACEAZ|nr:hydantoinase/oxoprolinase family protein [Acetohalobium arabaticum]ADL13325.1 Hydantoinase/oxoprolinase [Acetohalobium arabaticum DSM 5501]